MGHLLSIILVSRYDLSILVSNLQIMNGDDSGRAPEIFAKGNHASGKDRFIRGNLENVQTSYADRISASNTEQYH